MLHLGTLGLPFHGHVVSDKSPVFRAFVSWSVKWGPHYLIPAHPAEANVLGLGQTLVSTSKYREPPPSSDTLQSPNSNNFSTILWPCSSDTQSFRGPICLSMKQKWPQGHQGRAACLPAFHSFHRAKDPNILATGNSSPASMRGVRFKAQHNHHQLCGL